MSGILVVSPHRDDAAFSCAIAIRELREKRPVVVSNFFTVSEYAPLGTVEPGSVTALRRMEDEAFANCAGIELSDLDLIDAPQRLSIHPSDVSTARPQNEFDAMPRRKVEAHIRSLDPELALVPLAIGDHIDHRIAQAGALAAGQIPLAFYEDLPYCARATEGSAEKRAQQLHPGLTPWCLSRPGSKAWKRRCAGFYPSQIDAETIEEIAEFSDRYQEGERLWVTDAAAALLRSFLPR